MFYLSRSKSYYTSIIHNANLNGKYVKVVGIDTTNRFPIFSEFLMRDMVYFVIAMALILIIMGLYLRSALITLFTLLDVVFSFGLAYFLYFLVFQIPHMPFMGFLAILLLIAIGADDVFIFYDTFDQMKAKSSDAGKLILVTLKGP